MKRVSKICILITLIFFSSFVFSQRENQNNIHLLENTNSNPDGLNQNFSHPQNEILIRQVEGVNFSSLILSSKK